MPTPLEIVVLHDTRGVAFATRGAAASGLAEAVEHHVFGESAGKRLSVFEFAGGLHPRRGQSIYFGGLCS
jgi:hypothetical protein